MRAVVLVLALCITSTAFAESAPKPDVSPKRRAAAVAAAVFPGILLRGTGSYLVHDKPTARRLLVTAGIGAGAVLIGGLATGSTGGSPYVLVPFVPMLVAGTGVVLHTWFADIYRAAGADTGRPRARTPWSVELATTYTHDAYRDRVLFRGAGRFARDRFEVGVGGYVDAKGAAKASDLDMIVRILGADPTGGVIEDGTWLGIRATGRWRKDDDDRVSVLTGEAELMGRLDMDRISSTLHGSFAELSTGLGIERAKFGGGATEAGGLLLGRFAWGWYVCERGEFKLFYDHRRDSLAGGIAAGRAAGFVGSVGAATELRITGPWAVRGELEIGSAWVATIGLRFLGGPP
jgi:hypothetical protein